MGALKTYEKAQQREIAKESLRAHGLTEQSVLTVTTDYVGNVGTAYSRVFITCGERIINITALVAWASGDEPKERKSDGRWVIQTKGMGYSRAHHIVSTVSYALFGRADAMGYDEI